MWVCVGVCVVHMYKITKESVTKKIKGKGNSNDCIRTHTHTQSQQIKNFKHQLDQEAELIH